MIDSGTLLHSDPPNARASALQNEKMMVEELSSVDPDVEVTCSSLSQYVLVCRQKSSAPVCTDRNARYDTVINRSGHAHSCTGICQNILSQEFNEKYMTSYAGK